MLYKKPKSEKTDLRFFYIPNGIQKLLKRRKHPHLYTKYTNCYFVNDRGVKLESVRGTFEHARNDRKSCLRTCKPQRFPPAAGSVRIVVLLQASFSPDTVGKFIA